MNTVAKALNGFEFMEETEGRINALLMTLEFILRVKEELIGF